MCNDGFIITAWRMIERNAQSCHLLVVVSASGVSRNKNGRELVSLARLMFSPWIVDE